MFYKFTQVNGNTTEREQKQGGCIRPWYSGCMMDYPPGNSKCNLLILDFGKEFMFYKFTQVHGNTTEREQKHGGCIRPWYSGCMMDYPPVNSKFNLLILNLGKDFVFYIFTNDI